MSRLNYLDYCEEDNPRIRFEIAGYNYGFTIRGFPKDSHEWLLEVLGSQMQEIHDRAIRQATKYTQDEIKKALGLI